jgi:beta-N-acetylhexosaminidase
LLSVDLPTEATPTPESDETLEPTATATEGISLTPTIPPQILLKRGDIIAIRTGVILDRNKHPVPDGTRVRFVLSQSENNLTRQVESTTIDGVAAASFNLDQLGLINIVVSSEPARNSATIQLNVNDQVPQPPVITTPTLTITATATEIPPTPQPTPKPGTILTTSEGYPTFLGWFLTVLLMAAGVALAYWFGIQFSQARWAVRWALLTLLGGLAAYNYLVLELPGGALWVNEQGLSAVLQAILFGQSIGFLAGWGWRLMAERRKKTQE